MKLVFKKLSILLLTISFTTPAYAVYPVIDAANLGQNITQSVKATITSYQTTLTAIQQTLETVNNTILIPARDALTVITIMKSGDNMRNLILGTAGIDPLLVDDPQKYLTNKALETVNGSLAEAGLNKIPEGESVLQSVLTVTRWNHLGVPTKLQIIASSPLLPQVKKRACTEDAITKLARDEVAVSGKPLDQAAFAAKRTEFWNAFCVGDPTQDTAQGRATAEALKRLNQARPEVAGWDSWLTMVSGDNPYTKNAKIYQALQEQANAAVSRAEADLAAGGGIKSLTECKARASKTIDGTPYANPNQAPCIQESIKQVSSVLNQTFKDAIAAPLDLLKASFGSGAGGLINTAFTTINLVQGISVAFNNLSNTSSGSGTTYTTVNKPVVNDLTSNQSAKDTLTGPPKKQLLAHQTALTTLQTTNQKYITDIAYFQSQLDSMKSCFDKLVNDYPDASSQTSSAYLYYENRKDINLTTKIRIDAEKTPLIEAQNYLKTSIEKINASNSSEEILNIFTEYQNKVDGGIIPDATTGPTREGEYLSFKGEIDQSIGQDGQLYTLNNTCVTLRQQYLSRNGNNGN